MFKNIFVLLSLILSLFVTDVAFAEDTDSNTDSNDEATLQQMKDILDTSRNAQDDFHNILAGMWGDFIFTGEEGEPTLLSKTVGYVNVLALILGVVIVTYVSGSALLNANATGEVLSKSWGSYWLPIRTAISFGLLVPSYIGGFAISTAQVLVIKLLIMASTSATFLWNGTIDNVIPPQIPEPTITKPYRMAYETSLFLGCALSISEEYNYGDNPAMEFIFEDGSFFVIKESVAENTSKLSTALSNVASALVRNIGSEGQSSLITQVKFWGGSCGTIEFAIPDVSKETMQAFSASSESNERNGLKVLTKDLGPVSAQSRKQMAMFQAHYIAFVNNLAVQVFSLKENGGYDNGYSEYTNVAARFYTALEDKETAVNLHSGRIDDNELNAPIIKYLSNYNSIVSSFVASSVSSFDWDSQVDVDAMYTEIVNEMKSGGWIYAGSFFYQLARLEEISQNAASGIMYPQTIMGSLGCTECGESAVATDSAEFITMLYQNSFLNPYFKSDGFVDHPEAKGVFLYSSFSINDSLSTGVLTDTVSEFAVNHMAKLGEYNVFSGNSDLANIGSFSSNNPFQFAANIGHGMNNLRYMVYSLYFVSNTTVEVVNNTKDSADASLAGTAGLGLGYGPVVGLIVSALNMLIEILSISITFLTAMSWVLAYYLPMMPALLWITLIGAYLLICIEAVVATPLAVILMATPEGEGISGTRMQTAITMLASVFLRPSLMVIGLVAAIFVAKYSFMILNAIFWAQAEGSVRNDLFGFFAIFSLYVISLHQVLSNSIKATESLPTAVLNWIGQGANAQFGQNEIAGAANQLENKENSFGSAGEKFASIFKSKLKN